MQCSPQELKETLLRHLDNDFNILDVQGVLQVITVLENYPITKESLEQTRIGKYVNEMRRKTNNRDLARRAKDLVRKWQSLYALPSASQPAPAVAVNVPTIGEPSSAASTLRESAEGVKQKQTATANGVRLPINKSENGLHAKTTSPAECATSVRSNHAPGRSRLPIDLQPRGGSKPCTPVTAGLHPSQSVPSFSVTGSASRTPKTSSNSKSLSTAQPIKSDKSSTSIEKAKNGKTLPRPSSTNGIDATGHVCNDKHVESVSRLSSFGADTDQKHSTVVNLGVRNGSLKNSQSPCNGIWPSHSGIEISNRIINLSKVQTPLTPDSAANESVQPRTVLKIKINRTSGSGSVSSPVGDRQAVTTPASAVRKISKETVSQTSVSRLISSPVPDTSSVVTPMRNKQKKVFTTAQLITRMHENGELHLVHSETISRIANNQIKHEADEAPQSVVPDGAKPRPHKRRRVDPGAVVHTLNEPPCMTDADLLRVKEERVRNYLRYQMLPDAELPTSMDNDLINLLHQLPQPSRFGENEHGSEFERPKAIDSVNYEQEGINVDIPYKLPELPAIDLSSIDWYSNDYTVEEFRPAPTYADLERLHYGQWEGVNGQRDHRGEWADWTQAYSVRSYNNDVLHILPYVDITD